MSAPPEDADVETASAGYAKRFDSPVGRWMLETQLGITMDLLSDLGSPTVLDVGGGHGQIAPALAVTGSAVTVLASNDAAVAVTLRPMIDRGGVDLLIGPLRAPPVAPKSFDAVVSYRLLAHAHDVPALIKALTESARKAVLVDYATSRSFNAVAELLFAAKKKVERNTRPFAVMKDHEIDMLFQANGFKRKARRPQFFWPMALHRALNSRSLSRSLESAAGALGLRALFGSPVIARFDRV
ncbi:MAG: methyltransferase domain-containing protein [Vicinamibacteria bacterium]